MDFKYNFHPIRSVGNATWQHALMRLQFKGFDVRMTIFWT